MLLRKVIKSITDTKYWLSQLRGSCEVEGGDHILDQYECRVAMEKIRIRYPNTTDILQINPVPYNPSGCVVRCTWNLLNVQNCYSRQTFALQFTWNNNSLVSGPGDEWRFVCKTKG